MRTFGLIGKKLTHSFSKRYFTEKFEKENIPDTTYQLFELPTIEEFPLLIKSQPTLRGLNVTIPYKLEVLPFLNEIDAAAQRIGAVNVIKVNEQGYLKGYNSDYYGFKESLVNFLSNGSSKPNLSNVKALILGTGGASKAVKVALEDLEINYSFVSRTPKNNLAYSELNRDILSAYQLIINTSPLGMYPQVNDCPEIPYHFLNNQHYLYDLVYNPETTLFMQKGLAQGASVINGLAMLYLQAEKSWQIWNEA
ncbi:MAG: shikimate dehydrogenase [Cytophagales bacterium]|nr:MAG: shikimate dehydrogenase [Cytophagales bacterium]